NQMTAIEYDSGGGLWVSAHGAITGGGSVTYAPVIYAQAYGEHAYYDPANWADSSYVRPTKFDLGFDGGDPFRRPGDFLHIGSTMCMLGSESVPRAYSGFGTWALDAAYKVALAENELWSERFVCATSTIPPKITTVCGPGFPACAAGETCVEDGPNGKLGFS